MQETFLAMTLEVYQYIGQKTIKDLEFINPKWQWVSVYYNRFLRVVSVEVHIWEINNRNSRTFEFILPGEKEDLSGAEINQLLLSLPEFSGSELMQNT